MPKFEIELDDKQEFIGSVPPELAAVFDRVKSTAHGEGFGKGAQKAAEEAKKQIEEAVKAEKLKLEAQLPLERAKWQEIEDLNKALKAQLEATAQEGRKTLTAREEAHAEEMTKKKAALDKREALVRTLVKGRLRDLAAQAGAREESLEELEVILQNRIGYDDDMVPYVKAEDGSPMRTTAGNPIAMEAFVKQYLDNHAHHRKPTQGRGGDARRGATFSPHVPAATMDAAKARIEAGDRTPGAINELFEASRKRAS